MKKRGYGSFLMPRLIAALFIGVMVFGITALVLRERYNDAISSGFRGYDEVTERLLESYDNGDINDMFINMYCNFYHPDYLRLARINDDGSFSTVYETNYDIIPVSRGIHDWIYVTHDEELLSEGDIFSRTRKTGFELNIKYRKCDELWDINSSENHYFANTYDMLSLSEGYYSNPELFVFLTEVTGNVFYPQLAVRSYYVDDEYLYLGKVSEAYLGEGADRPFGKKWDFTDESKKDLYMYYESDIGDILDDYPTPTVFVRICRPDAFFEQTGSTFLTDNIDDLSVRTNGEISLDYGNTRYYGHVMNTDGYRTRGKIEILEIGENKYLYEIIATSMSFNEFYRPTLIICAVFLLVICAVIAMLAAVRPYRQYKKAYENNEFKNNLIDSLAHNLKTPLQILGGYAENLKDATDEKEKAHYSDSILAKINEMNTGIEAILKTAENSNPVLKKGSVREVFEEAAKKTGAETVINGDKVIPMDREYFCQAVFCLLDNATKYKTDDSKTEVKISPKDIVISNRTGKDKFTPGTGIAIAERILEHHGLKLKTELKDGVFEARISKNA